MSYRVLQDEIRDLTHLDKLKLQKYLSALILKEYEELQKEPTLSFDEQVNTLRKELGLRNTQLSFNEDSIAALSKDTDVIGFFDALRVAIHNLKTSGKDHDSLYGLIKAVPSDYGLTTPPEETEIQATIQKGLQHKNTTITLVTPETQFQAEEGESAEDYWIFLVQYTPLSSGLNWALVHRQTKEAYNYGFN